MGGKNDELWEIDFKAWSSPGLCRTGRHDGTPDRPVKLDAIPK
jgi:hypothetical protein